MNRRIRFWFVTAVALGLLNVACSSSCRDSLGTYPPPTIVVTGTERVEVPHIGWECPGYHSDSIDPPPTVTPSGSSVQLEATLEEETIVDVRLGNQVVSLDPAPREGDNTWVIQVPSPSEPLVVRICSSNEACALYWANLYPE